MTQRCGNGDQLVPVSVRTGQSQKADEIVLRQHRGLFQ
ncbi:hypothetical protein VTJ04DRAFT_1828 [Mycothermus thermophilus]